MKGINRPRVSGRPDRNHVRSRPAFAQCIGAGARSLELFLAVPPPPPPPPPFFFSSTKGLTRRAIGVPCSTNWLNKDSQNACRGRRPALPHLQRSRRPDEARHGRPSRGGRRHGRGAGRPLRRLGPGGVQARQGADRRRPGEPDQGRATAAVPPRSGGLRSHDEVDRALPRTGPGALRPSRRRARRDARRRTTHRPPAPTQGAAS